MLNHQLKLFEEDDMEVRCHKAMVAIGDLQRYVDFLKTEFVEPYVLATKTTQNVCGVRATYNNPRKSYDYESPFARAEASARAADDEETLAALSQAVSACSEVKVNYRDVLKLIQVEPDVFEGDGPGTVSFKVT